RAGLRQARCRDRRGDDVHQRGQGRGDRRRLRRRQPEGQRASRRDDAGGLCRQPGRRHPRRHQHRPGDRGFGGLQAHLQPAPAGALAGRARAAGGSGDDRPARPLRGPAGAADLRGHAGPGPDGPGPPPPRPVRRCRAGGSPGAGKMNERDIRMSRTFNVAVVGATGAVGEAMLEILAERNFPVGELHALASERSAGKTVAFGNRKVEVKDLAEFDPAGVDIALFSAGGSVSRAYAPKFAAAGAVVIDNSSAFRYDDDVPLVVAEVNPEALADRPRGIIANPNCSTMQLVVALAPIHRAVGIARINVATYQSVSGAGRSAMEELGRQTAALLNFQPHEPVKLPVQIAFNLIPHIDEFLDNGFTREEMKMVWETRKILGD